MSTEKYVDPDTGFESDGPPSADADVMVRLTMASHVILKPEEERIIKQYRKSIISREDAGRALIDLKFGTKDGKAKCHGTQHVESYSWWEYDGNGIPLCKVCDNCKDEAMKKYRPEVLKPYTQADVDEPIEEE